jgi:hypothetical protein
MSEFQATAVVSLELPDDEIDSLEDRMARAEIGGGGGGSAGAMTSLAEDRNDLLRQLLDEVEDGGLGAGGGGGGAPGGLGLAQVAAAGSAGFALDQLARQGSTGPDESLGPVADLLMDADTEGEAAKNTRKRLFGQEDPPVDTDELSLDPPKLELPEVPNDYLPEIPDPQPGFFPDIPEPHSAGYWPDIPEPEDIGVAIPDELQEIADALTGGGPSGAGTRPNSSVPNNLMNPEGTGTGSLSVDVSDFGIDIPTGRELEREIQSTVESLIKEYLEREVLP